MGMGRLAPFGTLFLVLAVAGSTAVFGLKADDAFDVLQAGPITYRIPKEYRAGGDADNNVFVQVRFADWGPIERDRPGWEDNVNILIGRQRAPIAIVYDHQYDGTPIGESGKWGKIERTYRIEPEFTVQEMGSTFDIIVPDQDRTTMPLGILRCTRPNPPVFPNASCGLLFDQDGQRWKITFGRQFLHRYGEFRERAVTLFDSFREADR